jgi:hypothetical protein
MRFFKYFFFFFSDIENLERKYHTGQLSATKFLDQAIHFFDNWTVANLEDSWNEEYGNYISQIDDARNASGFDELNQDLPDVEVDGDDQPASQPAAMPPVVGPGPRTFNACAVCYGEMNHDNWFFARPCKHCFCETCLSTEIFPPKLPDETFADHFLRCKPCPTCRSHIIEIEKLYPNYLTLTEGDIFIPVVHDDDNDAGAGMAAAVVGVGDNEEEEEDEAAAARRLENQRLVANLMYSNRHRGSPRPTQNWDTLQDEVDLEDFDLNQPHSQSQSQRPLSTLGERGRRGRGRGRGGQRKLKAKEDRKTVIRQLDQRAKSILKGKQPLPRPAQREDCWDPNEPGPSSGCRKRKRCIGLSSSSDSD